MSLNIIIFKDFLLDLKFLFLNRHSNYSKHYLFEFITFILDTKYFFLIIDPSLPICNSHILRKY